MYKRWLVLIKAFTNKSAGKPALLFLLQKIKKWDIGWLLLLALPPLALYSPYFSTPPFFDDLNYFNNSAYIAKETFEFAPRWLARWTLGRTFEYLGPAPEAFRAVNLAIHITNSIILFFLARKLLAVASKKNKNSFLAFSGAMLFVVHPVASFAAGYIVQRTILMSLFFGLLALLALCHGATKGKLFWLYSSVLFYLLACLSKEHAVTFYAIFLVFLVWLYRSRSVIEFGVISRQHYSMVFLLYSIVAGMVVAGKAGIFFAPYEPNVGYLMNSLPIEKNLAYPLSVITQMGLFFKYVALWLVPNITWMSVDMREPFATAVCAWPYCVSPLFFIGYLVLASAMLWRGSIPGLAGMCMLIPGLMFFTELTTIRLQDPFVLYRSYLWLPISYVLAVGLIFSRIGYRLAWILLTVTAVAFFLFSLNQLNTFSRPVFIWDQAARVAEGREKLIGLDRIYHNRGLAYYDMRLAKLALNDYTKAIELAPTIPYSYVNRGALYYDLHEYKNALNDFNIALSMTQAGNAYMGRGLVFSSLGDIESARKDFIKACKLGMTQACNKIENINSTLK